VTTLTWKKTYKGPFIRSESLGLVQNLREISDPDINLIYDARIRSRRNTNKYDVYIKTTRD